jgi:hypothetical protein
LGFRQLILLGWVRRFEYISTIDGECPPSLELRTMFSATSFLDCRVLDGVPVYFRLFVILIYFLRLHRVAPILM